MKYFYTLLLLLSGLLISSHSVAQGSLAALDGKNGFRDAKLGMSLSQFRGMVRFRKAENMSFYRRASDKMVLGDIPLKEISYTFYKGKLESISIEFPQKYLNEVIETLKMAYGEGGKDPSKYQAYYNVWKSKLVILDVMIPMFSEKPENSLPSINFTSILLSQQMHREQFQESIDRINTDASKRKSDL
jgi:hypothetical protein